MKFRLQFVQIFCIVDSIATLQLIKLEKLPAQQKRFFALKQWYENIFLFLLVLKSIMYQGANASQLEKEINSEPTTINDHYYGLVNFGNTCYCNSVIQALYFCRPFREKVLQYKQQLKKSGMEYIYENQKRSLKIIWSVQLTIERISRLTTLDPISMGSTWVLKEPRGVVYRPQEIPAQLLSQSISVFRAQQRKLVDLPG